MILFQSISTSSQAHCYIISIFLLDSQPYYRVRSHIAGQYRVYDDVVKVSNFPSAEHWRDKTRPSTMVLRGLRSGTASDRL